MGFMDKFRGLKREAFEDEGANLEKQADLRLLPDPKKLKELEVKDLTNKWRVLGEKKLSEFVSKKDGFQKTFMNDKERELSVMDKLKFNEDVSKVISDLDRDILIIENSNFYKPFSERVATMRDLKDKFYLIRFNEEALMAEKEKVISKLAVSETIPAISEQTKKEIEIVRKNYKASIASLEIEINALKEVKDSIMRDPDSLRMDLHLALVKSIVTQIESLEGILKKSEFEDLNKAFEDVKKSFKEL